MSCSLPTVVRSMCKYGCIYREPAFKHLACKIGLVQKQACVAPCYSPCDCTKGEKQKVQNEIKEYGKKWLKKNAKPKVQLL